MSKKKIAKKKVNRTKRKKATENVDSTVIYQIGSTNNPKPKYEFDEKWFTYKGAIELLIKRIDNNYLTHVQRVMAENKGITPELATQKAVADTILLNWRPLKGSKIIDENGNDLEYSQEAGLQAIKEDENLFEFIASTANNQDNYLSSFKKGNISKK